ncbi:hypothetical protein [uncultured Salinicola sp.]|uniref:hypothetical protein n=1 Tax=uncultured Salinicola sp. TaxID=1193542 RepID=UPI0026112638|nr:hypothetical protein [uncultured Salinicola sp.]|tara:strand:+ start:1344 stop:1832 length:489 start_codon:yes stop_codon:yes gene_type:complete
MTAITVEDHLEAGSIRHLCDLTIIGRGPAEGILVTNREISDPRSEARRLTPERMRIADHLLHPSPVREMLIAHKTISEWIEQDQRRAKPPARIEARRLLEDLLNASGIRCGTPGRYGGWLTSSMPTSEADGPEATVGQALRAFAAMIGKRRIYVVGREKSDA